MVALLAIFFDAAVGHALAWENDPYWTYWVTKTFLIATIFGLGTAWAGIGAARGAVITAVHTVVLTVYYWSLAPVGLPSSPEWLDLEHTWITGVPIHFGVIYLGYLTVLWLWRRRARIAEDVDSRPAGVAVLVVAVAIVVVAGGATSLALGDFPGVTWFLTRLLVTIPFLLWWWAWAGMDGLSAVTGGVVLAFVWATYGHFLGPVGLPDLPLRVFDASPPSATVEFLDYRQTWGISFPIQLVAMVAILAVASVRYRRGGPVGRPAAAVAVLSLFLVAATSEQTLGQEGTRATVTASGPVQLETGAFYSDAFEEGSGDIRLVAEDMGGRVTPLPPQDRLSIDATVQASGGTIVVTVRDPLVNHPLGQHTTWWGVGLGVEHHGESGIGTPKIPGVESEVAVFGLGDVSVDGQTVATGVPVHVMTVEDGLPGDATLELDVGMEGVPIPGVPQGHVRALWTSYRSQVDDPGPARYAIGVLVLLALLVGAFVLAQREPGRTGRRRAAR
jgi:hypothetical protein